MWTAREWPASAGRDRGRHRRPARSWLALTERVLTDWPTTLRTSLLLLVTGASLLALIAITLGVVRAVLLITGLGTLLRRMSVRSGQPT